MNFTHLVGNTPMIRIRYKLDGREGFVWAKLEAYNLSGSIKDRLAAHVITKSTANGTMQVRRCSRTERMSAALRTPVSHNKF